MTGQQRYAFTGLFGDAQTETYPKYMLPGGAWTTDPDYALRIHREHGTPEIQLKTWLGEHYTEPEK
jgi:hypothetical protein